MTIVPGQHGGCFACGGGHGAVLWSTSDVAKVAAACQRRGLASAGCSSVSLCTSCHDTEPAS